MKELINRGTLTLSGLALRVLRGDLFALCRAQIYLCRISTLDFGFPAPGGFEGGGVAALDPGA